jgi:trigger factor
MQVTETQTDGLKRQFTVHIAAGEIDEKIESRLRELGQRVKVPGFRPGKVPLPLLKKRFGPSVLGEIIERAVNDSSAQAIAERGLKPALKPKIEITSYDEGKDLEYTLDLEVMPEISPMDFSKLALERVKLEVPESEVGEALERLASSRRRSEPLKKPRKSKKDDVVVIDFRGSVEGEELPGMAGEDHYLELGSNRFIAGFEDQLIGAGTGESREVKVTFPEDYGNERLAGREALFQVTVKEIREAVPFEVDDELAKALGEESLEGLREKVQGQIEAEYATLSRTRLKRQLLDHLAEAHDFPVPPGMVDMEFDTIWQQVQSDLESGEADPNDSDRDEEALKGEYREIAARRVRLGLLLSEVGESNGNQLPQEEPDRALVYEAQRYPGKEREVIDFYRQNPQAMANLRAPLFEDKVIDFIVDLAEVAERPMTPEELRAEIDAESAAEEASEGAKAKGAKTKGKAKSGAKAKSGGKAGAKAEEKAEEKAGAKKKPAKAAKPKAKSES